MSARGTQNMPDFDPTGTFAEEDSDEDGDPFDRMVRDRNESMKIRLSNDLEESKLDVTRAST